METGRRTRQKLKGMRLRTTRFVMAWAIVTVMSVIMACEDSRVHSASVGKGERYMAALQYYLGADCSVFRAKDPVARPLEQILDPKLSGESRQAIETNLIRILREGVDKQMMTAVRGSLDQEWKRRQAFLYGKPPLADQTAMFDAAKKISKEDFINRRLRRLSLRFRLKSVFALAAIGSPKARQALINAAEDAETSKKTRILRSHRVRNAATWVAAS